MTKLDNIFNLMIPDDLAHTGFELADRRQRQHIPGILFIALCTLVINTNMGQAGIGTIHQAKVSNYCPVPQNAVIARPQMMFLFFDHHLNRPTLEISADNFLHRHTNVIGNQCNNSVVVPAFGENDFNFTVSVQAVLAKLYVVSIDSANSSAGSCFFEEGGSFVR